MQSFFSQNLSSLSLSQTAAFSIYNTYFALTSLNLISSTVLGIEYPPLPNLSHLIVSPLSSIVTFPTTLPILLAVTCSCSLENSVINSRSSITSSLSVCSSTRFTLVLGIVLLAI